MGVEGYPGIWALGDCAMIPDEHGGYQPPTAQHASREGKVLAHNIVANSLGKDFLQYLHQRSALVVNTPIPGSSAHSIDTDPDRLSAVH
jgi:NADH dehydrogenase FAD-containing subunit